MRQGVAQGGVEGGDRLADAGRRLEQEVLLVGDGGLDGGEDQLLPRPRLAVGEDQPLGRRVALGGAALLEGLPGVEERVDPAADGVVSASKLSSGGSRSVSLLPMAISTSSARTAVGSVWASIQA